MMRSKPCSYSRGYTGSEIQSRRGHDRVCFGTDPTPEARYDLLHRTRGKDQKYQAKFDCEDDVSQPGSAPLLAGDPELRV